jgi:spermidine synthase
MLYVLFFASGLSGLIYQVVWVRMFGNVFGNTIHSASLVVAIFMLGLGSGSYLVGAWADRRYAARPESLLRAYGQVELVIAALGFGVAAVLPHLTELSALISSYSREPSGWYALSATSYLARAGIAIVLLTPITMLMGGTLTLLIRHLVRSDLEIGAWRIALLYGVNTAGAALGALLTDFALVPVSGLWGAQTVAVCFNIAAGSGAFYLASRHRGEEKPRKKIVRAEERQPVEIEPASSTRAVAWTSAALAMTGLAAMGMEILWFRHFTILVGGFRAVFSLLLAIILAGIGTGSLAGGFLHRRTGRPAEWFMLVQGLFVASTLAGLFHADVSRINEAADTAQRATGAAATSGLAYAMRELWFNLQPMTIEVAIPALLMGFSFPLANAVIQRTEPSVGRRAGALYLANTAGAVCGSLAAGFILLPRFGLQTSAAILMGVAAAAPLALYFSRVQVRAHAIVASVVVSITALVLWLTLPGDYVTKRALGPPNDHERLLTISDGLMELIAITETPGLGRTLTTNGHPMSSTRPLSQRYMRALAHIPLLSIDTPETVLVIGFGVGNTTQAATLHPSIRRVEVADLSRGILGHASYFKEANKDVLRDPRLALYINDGRQHLQMQPRASYDLITLEPPPIAYAGVAALYSREFYALARTRLRPHGYISQWLPAYQVPPETTLAMVRAFVDVFPQAVLLSGAESDLLLLGANDSHIEIDPEKVAARLAAAPAVRADLERVDLGRIHEIVGTFIGSARTLAEATQTVAPVTDDRPLQEYGVRSMLNFGRGVPGSLIDLSGVAAWCPTCFADGRPVPALSELDTYFELLDLAYQASPADVARAKHLAEQQRRTIAGSAYLGGIVPESAELHNVLGIALAVRGRLDEAIAEFRAALSLDPGAARTHWHLGAALAAKGADQEATEQLRRAAELEPNNSQVHNDLGITLARQGRLEEAASHFERALALDPEFDDARRSLEVLRQQLGHKNGRFAP